MLSSASMQRSPLGRLGPEPGEPSPRSGRRRTTQIKGSRRQRRKASRRFNDRLPATVAGSSGPLPRGEGPHSQQGGSSMRLWRMLKRWRKAWAARGSSKARRRLTARPWLEPLEDRFCPAVSETWTAAVSNAWDVAGNWQLTGGGAGQVPGVNDTAVFDPAVANVGVNSPTDTPLIAQLIIKPNYNATISLKSLSIGNVATDTSTLQGSGGISLASNGSFIIDAGTFNWSSGSISSLFNQPPGGGATPPPFTVDSGVTVNITGSANFAGNFDLYNSGDIVVSTSNNITVGNGDLVVIYPGASIDVRSDVGFV